jgi:hypothetical protein
MVENNRVSPGPHSPLLRLFLCALFLVAATTPGDSGAKAPQVLPPPTEIPSDQDPWKVLMSAPPSGEAKTETDVDAARVFWQRIADESFERNRKNFSLFAFLGGPLLFLVFPGALFLSWLTALLLQLRRGASKSRAADVRRFGISFAVVFFLFWTSLSCFRGYIRLQDPLFGEQIWADSVSLLTALSPPLPPRLVTAAERRAGKYDVNLSEVDQHGATQKKNKPIRWALVLALGAVVVGAGRYLDDYMISKELKSRIRDFLIMAFLFVEKPSIPEFEKPLLRALDWVWARLRLWTVPLLLVSAYWVFVTFIYLTRQIIVGPAEKPYWKYLALWPFDSPGWLLYTLWALITVLGSIAILVLFLRLAKRRESLPGRLGLALLGVAASLAVVLNGYIGLILFFPVAIAYGDIIPFGAIILSSLPSLSTGLLILTLLLLRALLAVIRAILLHVFDKASDPKVCPFTYATTLVSLIFLGLKALSEWK